MNRVAFRISSVIACFCMAGFAHADMTVSMHKTTKDGAGSEIGTVTITESEYGLVFTPDLSGLETGIHGFHVHEKPNCDAAEDNDRPIPGLAAGGHLDPDDTDAHGAPWGEGHLGDLPALYVDSGGAATTPVMAPRLESLDDVKDRSLMVHEGGDNYSDDPEPMGGGGDRVACGVIAD